MKNMKIKSYTFKKNSVLSKETSKVGKEAELTEKKSQNINIQNSTQSNKQAVLSDVEKILKTPSLNISLSKADDKGNRLIDINFYNNNVINNQSNLNSINNSNIPSPKSKKTELNNNYLNNQVKTTTKQEVTNLPNKEAHSHIITENKINNKINIKLNINSEVINNNIRIDKKSTSKSSNGVSPNTSISEENKKLDYYKDLVKEREDEIEQLKKELANAKTTISNLSTGGKSNSFDSESGVTKRVNKGQSNSMSVSQSNQQTQLLSNVTSPTSPVMSNSSTMRKGLFTLDLTKNINKHNYNNELKISSELFSDRPAKNSSHSQSLLKNLSSGKKTVNSKNMTTLNMNQATLFRQSNKVNLFNATTVRNNYNYNNESLISKNTLHNPNNTTYNNVSSISPVKSKNITSKPIEEILQSTVKLIDNNKVSEDIKKIASNNKEINEELRKVKSRAQKVLNTYSEMVSRRKSKSINN